jgi:hypothetical protein
MSIIAQVGEALRGIFTQKAEELARQTKFIKRQVKIRGSWFAQTLVFGWLMEPQATLEALTQTGAALGIAISPQALDQRFTREASDFLKALLDAATAQVVSTEAVAIELLSRFTGVYLEDSTIITLPTELAPVWAGCGGDNRASKAAVKVEVGLDMLCGRLVGPLLEAGRVPDRGSALQQAALPAGALRITDLGYWSLDQLEQLSQAQVFWLLRTNPQLHLTDSEGRTWDLLSFVQAQAGETFDCPIALGAHKGLPARLLGQRVPPAVAAERRRKLKADAKRKGQTLSARRLALADWSLFVTNVPPEQLTLAEALVLARLRWQIELLFKLWKSHGRLDEAVTTNPWRILCEFYAKLLAMMVQHWLFLTCCWAFPERSLVKAANTVRQHALCLALALPHPLALDQALLTLQRTLQQGCRINKSRKTLRTYQLLMQFGESTP